MGSEGPRPRWVTLGWPIRNLADHRTQRSPFPSQPTHTITPDEAVEPLDILILRDPRESVKKCSLTPLRGRVGVRFLNYDPDARVEVHGRLLLHPDGELLTPEDRAGISGLLLVDSAWRRLPKLLKTLAGEPVRRRLPPLRTAYPRKSHTFEDPERGLASIEALYAALAMLGETRGELLEGYRWGDSFLELNPTLPRPG